jgi:hypothetical protein
MADITFLSPSRGELLNPAQVEALSRAARGFFFCGYVGCRVSPTSPASNRVLVDAGSYCYNWQLVRRQSQTEVTIPNCSEVYYRKDVLYAKSDGSIGIHQGENSVIEDPLGQGDWKQYIRPYTKENIPDGVILGEIFVVPRAGGSPVIEESHIWMYGVRGVHRVLGEIPTPAPNGSVTTFTFSYPIIPGTEEIYVNGIRCGRGSDQDYTISGSSITFTWSGSELPAGTKIVGSYST